MNDSINGFLSDINFDNNLIINNTNTATLPVKKSRKRSLESSAELTNKTKSSKNLSDGSDETNDGGLYCQVISEENVDDVNNKCPHDKPKQQCKECGGKGIHAE